MVSLLSMGNKSKSIDDIQKVNRTEMANTLNVDIAHISRIFSGKSTPSLELALRIAEYLHITVDGLCKKLGIPRDKLPE